MNTSTRLFAFGLVLAFSAQFASATNIFNNNSPALITTMWPGFNKATCFGLTIWEDSSATSQGETDICLVGLIGGAIILVGYWPQIGLGSGLDFNRRRVGPATPLRSKYLETAAAQESFSARIAESLDDITASIKEQTPNLLDVLTGNKVEEEEKEATR